MAKSGEVTSSGSNAEIQNAVTRFSAPILTLAQIAALALNGSNSALRLIVDPTARTVKVLTNGDAINTDDVSHNALAHFTQDADGKVTPWTGALQVSTDDSLIAVANAAAKPQRSLAGLLAALEDAISETGPVPPDSVFIVDQSTGKVSVFATDDMDALLTATTIASFTQTVPEGGSVIHNAFE